MIRARALTVRDGDRALLAGVDLDVAPGEMLLVTGPNGSGKSTLLRALAGLLPRDGSLQVSGEATVAGVDALRAAPGAPLRHAGFLLQQAEHQLFGFTVEGEVRFKLENLAVPRGEGLPRAQEALARFGLQALAHRESTAVSGGEAKRVALAQQWAPGPPVLLLDEPLAGLDAPSRERLLRDIASLKGRCTLVVVEHDAAPFLSLADRTLLLSPGQNHGGAEARSAVDPPLLRFSVVSPGRPLIEWQALQVAPAPGAPPVVRGVTGALGAGVHALLGANGSGKSTLLRATAGLLAPQEGALRVAGSAAPDPRDLGYLPQMAEDLLTEDTVVEELALGPRLLRVPGDAGALAARFGLAPLMDRHPLSLSGGERQRLALAACLAHTPRVLLLDEPTAHLDAEGRALLLQVCREEAARGACVLVATHDEAFAEAADTRLHLHEGRLRAALPEVPA